MLRNFVEKIAKEHFGSNEANWSPEVKLFMVDMISRCDSFPAQFISYRTEAAVQHLLHEEGHPASAAWVEELETVGHRFKALLENNEDGLMLFTAESMIIYQNEVVDRVSGYNLKDRRGRPGYSFIHKEDQSSACELWNEVLNAPNKAFHFQFRLRARNRKYIWIEGVLTNRMADENIAAIVANFRDISKRKEAEQALTESEKKYRELFETMQDGVYKSSHQGRFLEVNPALVKMLGYDSKEELIAIDIKKDLYFEESERDHAIKQDIEGEIAMFRLKKKDGSEIWVEDRGQYIYDEKGNTLYHEGVLRDVTKRVTAEIRLRESMKETADYQQALDQSLIVSATDKNGIIRYANKNLCTVSGYTKEELVGNSHRILNSHYHSKEYMEKMWTTILAGNVWRGELRDKKKNGDIFWIDSTIVPFKNEYGKPYLFLAIAVDITEQKEMMEELSDRYTELEKINKELDRFVYSVTHDLRAPLSSMLGVLEIAADDNKDEEMSEHISLLVDSVKKLDGFIKDILDYSKNARTEVKGEVIDFTDIINSITKELKYMGEGYMTPEFHFSLNDSSSLKTDRVRLNIILSNLVSNAIRYQNTIDRNPEVRIRVDVDAEGCTFCVSDNGIGITQENQDRIFDMFYRVSEQSAGSGLGLYIVKEAVDKLNGTIELESELGVGSTFTVWIPQLP